MCQSASSTCPKAYNHQNMIRCHHIYRNYKGVLRQARTWNPDFLPLKKKHCYMIELSMVCMDLLHIWSGTGACSPYFCTRFPALPALQNRREVTSWMSLHAQTGPRSIVDLIFHRDSLKFELSSGFSSANSLPIHQLFSL